MKTVVIYTTDYCPYCVKAKSLLDSKAIAYQEIDVTNNQLLREEMETKSNRRTVPQIFIGEQHVGGCDDLHALEASGKLDTLVD